MNLTLLGTGGADGIPGIFAEDRISAHARRAGGKDVRTRAAAIIDRSLKIDFGPDTAWQVIQNGLNPCEWTGLVFTHSHEDHLAVAELQYALFPFVEAEAFPFGIYGNAKIAELLRARYPDWPFEMHVTKSFEPFTAAGCRITPIAAKHDPDEDCQNLIIESGGVSLLYATDTGWWDPATWEFLSGCRLDSLVIECTNGLVDDDYVGHLNAASCVRLVDRLRSDGVLAPNGSVFTTHHSHNGSATHAELEKALEPHRIQPGYDGLSVDLAAAWPASAGRSEAVS